MRVLGVRIRKDLNLRILEDSELKVVEGFDSPLARAYCTEKYPLGIPLVSPRACVLVG